MNQMNQAIVDGERYSLWPDGNFCRINEVESYTPVLGHDYQEVIGVGRDDSLQAYVAL